MACARKSLLRFSTDLFVSRLIRPLMKNAEKMNVFSGTRSLVISMNSIQNLISCHPNVNNSFSIAKWRRRKTNLSSKVQNSKEMQFSAYEEFSECLPA